MGICKDAIADWNSYSERSPLLLSPELSQLASKSNIMKGFSWIEVVETPV